MPSVPSKPAYSYATVRVVPRVDRDEFINAGVILYSPETGFLGARTRLDRDRLLALWPTLDADLIYRHLSSFEKIAEGDASGGPIATLPKRERFHWLTAPRSAMIQISPVRTGVSETPEATLESLSNELVGVPDGLAITPKMSARAEQHLSQ